MEEQNVNYPGNFSLCIFQPFCLVIQENINLSGCQEGTLAEVNRCSWRRSVTSEAARVEESSIPQICGTLVPQICEGLALPRKPECLYHLHLWWNIAAFN